ncbi:MAG: hypothetical protein ACRDHO_12905 [Actinomycetota bacterium]
MQRSIDVIRVEGEMIKARGLVQGGPQDWEAEVRLFFVGDRDYMRGLEGTVDLVMETVTEEQMLLQGRAEIVELPGDISNPVRFKGVGPLVEPARTR